MFPALAHDGTCAAALAGAALAGAAGEVVAEEPEQPAKATANSATAARFSCSLYPTTGPPRSGIDVSRRRSSARDAPFAAFALSRWADLPSRRGCRAGVAG